MIRGENVVFCGEIDEQKEMQDRIRLSIEQVPVEQILISQRAEAEERERLNRASEKLFKSYGFLAEMEKESF